MSLTIEPNHIAAIARLCAKVEPARNRRVDRVKLFRSMTGMSIRDAVFITDTAVAPVVSDPVVAAAAKALAGKVTQSDVESTYAGAYPAEKEVSLGDILRQDSHPNTWR
jgi:hypothetical protein